MRRSLILLLIVSAAYGLGIYQLKYRVAHLESNLQKVQREVIAENESIHILSAEISYVTRPDQIAKLSEKHLQLSPIKVAQIYQLADVMPGVAYSRWADAAPRDAAPVVAAAVDADGDGDGVAGDVLQSPVSYEVQ